MLRSDKASGNCKGGVLTSVPNTIELSHTSTFITHGIEGLTTRLRTHAHNADIQIALLYGPPNVPTTMFQTILTTLVTHMSLSNMPTLMLGDFNEDLYDK